MSNIISITIYRIGGGKKPTLGRALAVTETQCQIEVFKMKGKRILNISETETTWIDRTFILCCNVQVQDEMEENCLFLEENPPKLLTRLGVRDV